MDKFDLEMTEEFLETLTGDKDTVLYFQSIAPDTKKGNSIPQNRQESFSTAKHWLMGRQRNKGDGVFVCINYVNEGEKLNAENVSKVNAVYIDQDDGPLPEEWKLIPSIVVQSSDKNKWHAYWVVEDVEPDEFKAMQQSLAEHFGSDKSVCNTNRIMRLPGFYHTKGEPILTEMIECNKRRYTKAQILEAYPMLVEQKKTTALNIETIGTRKALTTYADYAMSLGRGQGERHVNMVKIACEGRNLGCFTNDEIYSVLYMYAEEAGLTADRDAGLETEILKIMDWVEQGPLGYVPQLIEVYLDHKMDTLQEEIKKDPSSIHDQEKIQFLARVDDSTIVSFQAKLNKAGVLKKDTDALYKEWKILRTGYIKAVKLSIENKAKDDGLLLVEDKSNFDDIAMLMKRERFTKTPLFYHNGAFYLYNGKCYDVISEDRIDRIIFKWFRKVIFRTSNGSLKKYDLNLSGLSNVKKALQSDVLYEGSLPSWTTETAGGPFICFNNGLLDLTSGELMEHTPNFRNTNLQAYDFDPSAECPLFLDKLSQWFPDEPESITTLKRMIGYLMSGENGRQKIFVLAGVPRSGKSTISNIIEQLMPSTMPTSYEQLGSKFGPFSLLGASVAILADATLGYSANKSSIIARLKQISGGDSIEIEPKNKNVFSAKLSCRFLIVTNDVIELGDASGALNKRLVPVKFTQSFYDKEDMSLGDKLKDELSGIANWAIEGLRELNVAKKGEEWLYSAASKDYIKSLAETSTPVRVFAEEFLKEGGEVSKHDLYQTYRNWCEEMGQKIPLKLPKFLAELAADGRLNFVEQKIQAYDQNGKPMRFEEGPSKGKIKRVAGIKGICLKHDLVCSGATDSGRFLPKNAEFADALKNEGVQEVSEF